MGKLYKTQVCVTNVESNKKGIIENLNTNYFNNLMEYNI
jgi:hypothetical protein